MSKNILQFAQLGNDQGIDTHGRMGTQYERSWKLSWGNSDTVSMVIKDRLHFFVDSNGSEWVTNNEVRCTDEVFADDAEIAAGEKGRSGSPPDSGTPGSSGSQRPTKTLL